MDTKISQFLVTKTDDDTFLATSTKTPRFCFVGETEEEVVEKANKALNAYFNGDFKPVARARPVRVGKKPGPS